MSARQAFMKKARRKRYNACDELVRLKGFEPPTYWFVASHSIQLSYRRMIINFKSYMRYWGFEPQTL